MILSRRCTQCGLCRCSSAAEQLFRKQQAVGSNPTIGSQIDVKPHTGPGSAWGFVVCGVRSDGQATLTVSLMDKHRSACQASFDRPVGLAARRIEVGNCAWQIAVVYITRSDLSPPLAALAPRSPARRTRLGDQAG